MVQNDLTGLRSRTYEAPHKVQSPHKAQVRPAASTTRHPARNFKKRAFITHVRASLESATPQQLALIGSTSRERLGCQLRQLPKKHAWTYSGLKIGLLYGPWYVPNATIPPPPKHVRGQRLNKRKLEFAKLLRLPGRAKRPSAGSSTKCAAGTCHQGDRSGDQEPLPS